MVTTHEQAKRICLAKRARTGGTTHTPKAVVRFAMRDPWMFEETARTLDVYRAYCR